MNPKIVLCAALCGVCLSSPASAQSFPQSLGGMISNSVGASVGGSHGDVVGAIVAGTISTVMKGILDSLTADEKKKRDAAIQDAARGHQGSTAQWSSKDTGGGDQPKKAKYVNKGKKKNEEGKSCTMVAETITLPDGKQGTSDSLVCPD